MNAEDVNPSETYEFTQDWFKWGPPLFRTVIDLIPAKRRFLEIGCFEGRSAVWLVENGLESGGILNCIDTWQGGEEHTVENMREVERRFNENIRKVQAKDLTKKINVYKQTSVRGLAHLIWNMPSPLEMMDLIYIDGSHQAPDVLADTCMAWQVLKVGGVIVFDDYVWGSDYPVLHKPKIAIDTFTNIYHDKLRVIFVGYQLAVQKIGD
jgi:predicted O-methyltransferase YrrM